MPEELANRIDQLVGKVRSLCRSAGRTDLAEELDTFDKNILSSITTLLVAGESNGGKSTLIGTLVDQELPADAFTAREVGAPVIYHHADSPLLRKFTLNETQGHVIEEGPVQNWRSANLKGMDSATKLEIGLKSAFLSTGLKIVDLPPPEEDARKQQAIDNYLRSEARSSMLIFVSDASAPINASELGLLKRASQPIGIVILVLTKIDLFRGWKEILEANRRIVREQLPQLASIPSIPISSALHSRARDLLASGEAQLAEQLRKDSGIEAIKDVIQRQIHVGAGWIRKANQVKLSRNILEGLLGAQRRVLGIAKGDQELKASLEAEQARWQQFTKKTATWSIRLNDETQDIRLKVNEELGKSLSEAKQAYEDYVRRLSRKGMDTLPADLAADAGTIADKILKEIQQGVSNMTERMTQLFGFASGQFQDAENMAAAPADFNFQDFDQILDTKNKDFASWLTAGGSISAVVFTAIRALDSDGLESLLFGLAGVGAVAATVASIATRRKTQRQQKARMLVSAGLAETNSRIRSEVERRLVTTSRAIRDIAKTVFENRSVEIEQALAGSRRMVDSDQATRQNAIRDSQVRTQELSALRASADDLLANLRRKATQIEIAGQTAGA